MSAIERVRSLRDSLLRQCVGEPRDVAVMALLDTAVCVLRESGQSNDAAAESLMQVLRAVRSAELAGVS